MPVKLCVWFRKSIRSCGEIIIAAARGSVPCRYTSRSGRSKPSGLRSTPFTRLNAAVLAPIASARVPSAISVNAGVRASRRAA